MSEQCYSSDREREIDLLGPLADLKINGFEWMFSRGYVENVEGIGQVLRSFTIDQEARMK